MSTNENFFGPESEPDPINVEDYEHKVSPKLVQGDLEVEPIAVTRNGGTLPWETDSVQIDGGGTLTGSSGDQHNQFVFKAIITKSDFDTLAEMRLRDEQLRLVSVGYTGPITFDELKWDRIPDANGAILRNGEDGSQALFQIQLQTKESDDNSTFFDASD